MRSNLLLHLFSSIEEAWSTLIAIFPTAALKARTIRPGISETCGSHAALTVFPNNPLQHRHQFLIPSKFPAKEEGKRGGDSENVKAAVLTSLLQLKFI